MHAIELAQMATIFARFSPAMVAYRLTPPREAQQQYWLQSKFRHEFWSCRLAAHRQEIQNMGVTHRRKSWLRIIPVLEEILISEPLTRCIAYHARLLAEQLIDSDFSTLANSALSSHIEARHRCLHLLVFGEGLSVEHSVRLNRIRRELECFTDSILGTLAPIDQTESICFDAFWTEQMRQSTTSSLAGGLDARGLHLDSIRHSLGPTIRNKLSASLACTPTNQKIADAVMGFLPSAAFDSFGLVKSIQLSSITADSADSCLSDKFFEPPSPTDISQLIVSNRPTSKSSASENRRWN